MAKTLMMDVDGVLIRGRPDDGRSWSTDLYVDLGLRAEDLHKAFFVPHWHDIVIGRAVLADRLSLALAEIAPHLTAEQLIAYWFRQDARVDEQLLSELGALRQRGVEVYLATNQDHRRADYIMRDLGFSQHVDGIHYSAALGCRKPDREFFRKVADRLQRAPADLLLIDDFLDNVLSAEAAGWSAEHWTGEKRFAELLESHFGM